MTLIGKLLVFLNLVMGLAFLSWSVGLYTNKLDWLDRTTAAGKVDGELTRLKAEIEVLSAQARVASKSWGDAHAVLLAAEQTREDRQKVFATRLEAARTNPTNGFNTELALPSSALFDTTRQGPPIMGPDGQPLRGAETLQQTITANDAQSEMFVKQSLELKNKQAAAQAEEKLYQERVNRHIVIYDNLLNEQRYLESFEINWYEQLVTVQRRKAQLVARVAEFAN